MKTPNEGVIPLLWGAIPPCNHFLEVPNILKIYNNLETV